MSQLEVPSAVDIYTHASKRSSDSFFSDFLKNFTNYSLKMAERNGRCKEVYDTCPQHIGFLLGFAVSLEFDELNPPSPACTPLHRHCVRGRPAPAR